MQAMVGRHRAGDSAHAALYLDIKKAIGCCIIFFAMARPSRRACQRVKF